jgi:hypothetical protein
MLNFGRFLLAFLIGLVATSILTSIAIIPTQCELEKRGIPMDSWLSTELAYYKLTSGIIPGIILLLTLAFTIAFSYNIMS